VSKTMNDPHDLDKLLKRRRECRRQEASLHAKLRTFQCEALAAASTYREAGRCSKQAVGDLHGLKLCRHHLVMAMERKRIRHFKAAT